MKKVAVSLLIVILLLATSYTVFFFSVNEETVKEEIERTALTYGTHATVGTIDKLFPFSLEMGKFALSIPGIDTPLVIDDIVLSAHLWEIFGESFLTVDIFDSDGDHIRVSSNLSATALAIQGENFDYQSPDETEIPSFSLSHLSAKFERSDDIPFPESVLGKGDFSFAHISTTTFTIPLTISDIKGKLFVRKGAIYLQDTEGVFLNTPFTCEGTIALFPGKNGKVSLTLILIDPSPVIVNFLNLRDIRGKKIKIIVGGTLGAPAIKEVIPSP